jgi:hypothetical protein
MDYDLECACGKGLRVTDTTPGASVKCSCGRDLQVPVLSEPLARPILSQSDRADDNRPAPWIAWIWVAGGTYMLVKSLRAPVPAIPRFVALFSAIIALGIGQMFIEYLSAFERWRVRGRYVMMGFALIALILVFWWDFSRFR